MDPRQAMLQEMYKDAFGDELKDLRKLYTEKLESIKDDHNSNEWSLVREMKDFLNSFTEMKEIESKLETLNKKIGAENGEKNVCTDCK